MTYNKFDTTTSNSKLFITFIKKENLEKTVYDIRTKYTVLYENIFVFENSLEESEYILSYSIDHFNVNSLLPATIAVHRKNKDDFGEKCNVIYSLNGINKLKQINDSDDIEWHKYKNSIILESKDKELRIIETTLVQKLK
jgi:hypothetical protein